MKRNSPRKILSLITIAVLVLLSIPMHSGPQAASISDASVTISDSTPQATGVTHDFKFTTNATATQITFTYESAFTTNGGQLPPAFANYTCPTGLTVTATTTNSFTCSNGTSSPGALTAQVTSIRNPNKVAAAGTADTYRVTIQTDGGDSGDVMFAIIEGVTVTATVSATLQFTISGVNPGQAAKNTTTTVTSTATTIPFGTLTPNATTVAAQDLSVTTNASDGFFVRVYQDGLLTSAGGDTIKTFKDNTPVPVTSTQAWAAPGGNLDQPNTYGHFGFASEDQGLKVSGNTIICGDPATAGAFGLKTDDRWAGFNGTNREPVFCHTGPSDGTTEHKGRTRVVYRVEISALQPAGEYTNKLTYIATPQY